MRDYQKAELTAKIVSAFEDANHIETPLQRLQFEKIINGTIMDYFENQTEIGGWSKEDVIEQAEKMGYECTDEIAAEVIAALDHHFDANIGINWDVIEAELGSFTEKMKKLPESEEDDELVVKIEVGGDHGDGNVEVIRKSKGVKLIIRDFDNARLDEENPEGDTIPATREWETDVSV